MPLSAPEAQRERAAVRLLQAASTTSSFDRFVVGPLLLSIAAGFRRAAGVGGLRREHLLPLLRPEPARLGPAQRPLGRVRTMRVDARPRRRRRAGLGARARPSRCWSSPGRSPARAWPRSCRRADLGRRRRADRAPAAHPDRPQRRDRARHHRGHLARGRARRRGLVATRLPAAGARRGRPRRRAAPAARAAAQRRAAGRGPRRAAPPLGARVSASRSSRAARCSGC